MYTVLASQRINCFTQKQDLVLRIYCFQLSRRLHNNTESVIEISRFQDLFWLTKIKKKFKFYKILGFQIVCFGVITMFSWFLSRAKVNQQVNKQTSKAVSTCSKSTIEKPKQCVKSVQTYVFIAKLKQIQSFSNKSCTR